MSRMRLLELPSAPFRCDAGGRILEGVAELCEILGPPAGEDASSSGLLADHLPGLDWDVVHDNLQGTTELRMFEVRVRREGEDGWLLMAIRRAEGRGYEGAVVDVTSQHRLGAILRRAKVEWETTFDSVQELIALADPTLNVTRLNRAWANRLDRDVRDLVGRPWTELLYGPRRAVRDQALHRFVKGGGSFELDLRDAPLGGRFLFSATPWQGSDGEVLGTILVGRDVTAERRAAELGQRQAMIDQAESIFRTFRHEAGNALNTLKTTLTVLQRNYERFSSDQRESYFSRCRESLAIAERLLASLRNYQASPEVHPRPVELNGFLKEKAGLLFENARAAGVTCRLKRAAAPVEVLADPDALTRILLNLVENAVVAVIGRASPRITITCRATLGAAVIDVADNGAGITAQDLPHVFAPLYTTKPEGSGMGLAIVQKLMVHMGGVTNIESAPDLGCMVELRLPLQDQRGGSPADVLART